MNTILISIVSYFVGLAILITVHEFGHFWIARRCGVKVLKFSIGFGRALFQYRDRKGTEFILGMIPFGGYVKMLDETEGPVKADQRKFAFNRQTVWKRVAIVIAGPLFNIIFAVFAFWMMYLIGIKALAPVAGHIEPGSIAAKAGLKNGDEIIRVGHVEIQDWRDFQLRMMTQIGRERVEIGTQPFAGTDGQPKSLTFDITNWQLDPNHPDLLEGLGIDPYLPPIKPIVAEILPDKPAFRAGFQKGDFILSVDGKPLSDWRDFVKQVRHSPGQTLSVEIKRGSETKTLVVNVAEAKEDGTAIGVIGLQSQAVTWPENLIRYHRFSLPKAFVKALSETGNISMMSFQLIGKLVTGNVSLRSISGPIGIAEGAGQSASIGIASYLGFLAIISISLGILNILPIPMLDGGHLLYYLIEILRGKPVTDVTREWGARLGLVALLGLMLVAIFNDVSRLIH